MRIGKSAVPLSGRGKITERYIQSCSTVSALRCSSENSAKAYLAAAEFHKINNKNVGHGIAIMRNAPQIPNDGSAGHEPRVKSGMASAQPKHLEGRSSCLNKM